MSLLHWGYRNRAKWLGIRPGYQGTEDRLLYSEDNSQTDNSPASSDHSFACFSIDISILKASNTDIYVSLRLSSSDIYYFIFVPSTSANGFYEVHKTFYRPMLIPHNEHLRTSSFGIGNKLYCSLDGALLKIADNEG